MDQKVTFKLELDASTVHTILAFLRKGAWEQVNEPIHEIIGQVKPQEELLRKNEKTSTQPGE